MKTIKSMKSILQKSITSMKTPINYNNNPEEGVRKALEEARRHLRFALGLCYEQHKAGWLFVSEHPVAATS
jgi:hypothetical protein